MKRTLISVCLLSFVVALPPARAQDGGENPPQTPPERSEGDKEQDPRLIRSRVTEVDDNGRMAMIPLGTEHGVYRGATCWAFDDHILKAELEIVKTLGDSSVARIARQFDSRDVAKGDSVVFDRLDRRRAGPSDGAGPTLRLHARHSPHRSFLKHVEAGQRVMFTRYEGGLVRLEVVDDKLVAAAEAQDQAISEWPTIRTVRNDYLVLEWNTEERTGIQILPKSTILEVWVPNPPKEIGE